MPSGTGSRRSSPSAASTRSRSRKTTVTFKGPRLGFAGARPKGDELVGYFDVTYRAEDPRIRSVAPYQQDIFVHHFPVSSMDDEFAGRIRDAYEQVGCGRR